MNNKKQALYESIMKDVAKVVREHLNEDYDKYDQYEYRWNEKPLTDIEKAIYKLLNQSELVCTYKLKVMYMSNYNDLYTVFSFGIDERDLNIYDYMLRIDYEKNVIKYLKRSCQNFILDNSIEGLIGQIASKFGFDYEII